MKAILGRKIGMTRVFKDGVAIPVTVIKAGPCYVVQKKVEEKDGYNAIQVGFEEISEKKVNKPLLGHFKRFGVGPFRILKEFRVENPDDYQVGQVIDLNIFNEGEKIDITGWSKGKGFQGAMRRWGFSGGPSSHGTKFVRELGSMGAATHISRIIKGKKMPGRLGNERITILNSEVVKIIPEENIIAVKGGVPGSRGSLVIIREAKKVKAPKTK
ncbi:MAG: large subunit ribosomal protein [Thermotogaceae bacterium]|jgi:large subunit ribosomal protein L3|nr:large subunit ribosomal protein [Thermotogaceae bacterium]MDN5337396.1 large subunit ribosomal protein [Thermotogaceae bacterium]